MTKERLTKMLLAGFLAFSLVFTSVGGTFASAALAAAPEETEKLKEESSSNKGLLGGLVALGVVAMLVKGGGKSSRADSPAKTPAPSTPQPASAPAPQTAPQPAPKPAPKPAPAPSPTPASGLSSEERLALDLLNADRAAQGLSPVRVNLKLVRLAEDYAQDMINRGFFSHYNPEGQSPFDRMKQYGVKYGYAGENLAVNTSVQGAEKAFMNSSGHRANILNSNFTQVGIGVGHNSNGSVYVVQEFTDG